MTSNRLYVTVETATASAFILILYTAIFAQSAEILDYAKLELNKQELLGSRWALEQAEKKSEKITVYHAFEIVDIVKLDLEGMFLRVDFHVRQRWTPADLEFPPNLFKDKDPQSAFITAEENVLKSVWSPDSYIPNARETKIHSVTSVQSVVNIYKNMTIVLKARMHSVLSCSFAFQWYPLDIQVCDLVFESYRYTNSTVEYKWEDNPVDTAPDIMLYQYDLIRPHTRRIDLHQRWGGRFSYPYVKITFKFERKLGNIVLQIFVPTTLVVILSWFSFWLGLDAVPGRVSLLITCMLTLVTMHSSLKGMIPPVHYIKMMDVWIITCMGMVFAAICEFVIVKYMDWRGKQRQKAQEDREKYLKENAALMNYPALPPAPPALRNRGGGYPALVNNMDHPYLQCYRNANEITGKSLGSAQQRQALGKGHMFGAYPDDFHIHPGLPTMLEMGRPYLAPPPVASRPLWITIDRISRVLFPVLFIAFNGAYWPYLLIGSANQHKDV